MTLFMSQQDFNSIQIQNIMTRAMITVNPATTAKQIAKMMQQGGIGAIFVKENDNDVEEVYHEEGGNDNEEHEEDDDNDNDDDEE